MAETIINYNNNKKKNHGVKAYKKVNIEKMIFLIILLKIDTDTNYKKN